MKDILELIRSRRSVREFGVEEVADSIVNDLLEAARWAPSGLNNQPWKFVVVHDKGTIKEISCCTKYKKIVAGAPLLIAVYLDKDEMYNYVKDVQAIGACIQNMLLVAHDKGLGAVWIGEILNRAGEVNEIFDAGEMLELMAVVAIGHPAPGKRTSSRDPLSRVACRENLNTPYE